MKGVILSDHQSIAVVAIQKEHGLTVHTVNQLPAELEQAIEDHVDVTKRK